MHYTFRNMVSPLSDMNHWQKEFDRCTGPTVLKKSKAENLETTVQEYHIIFEREKIMISTLMFK